ncbi:MAG TPA: ankyrin repeat domain-containing protein [Bacteroidales bacterium]|jgi:ankyrin repeat protein|nr:ankyrin repeat domain-containing protein [Bacteroidales bacterium]
MTLIDYVKLGNVTKVQELIVSGVNLNHQDEYGYTALIWAASYSKPDMVKLLLEAGADDEITDVDKHNALYWANYYGHPEVIELLNKSLDGKKVLTKKKKGK